MSAILIGLAIWGVASVLVALLVGAFIHFGGSTRRDETEVFWRESKIKKPDHENEEIL